jgi:transposase
MSYYKKTNIQTNINNYTNTLSGEKYINKKPYIGLKRELNYPNEVKNEDRDRQRKNRSRNRDKKRWQDLRNEKIRRIQSESSCFGKSSKTRQIKLDQWGACDTPEVWRSDKMTIKPQRKNKKKAIKLSYQQDWKSYNLSQTNEFRLFQDILIELIDNLIDNKLAIRQGHPFNDLKEMVFCCVMRSYYGKSSRRSVSYLDYAITKGFLSKKPHFNTILNYYKDIYLIPILKYMIEKSGIPLKEIENDFTIDASGFSTSLFGRWLDVRMGSKGMRRVFKKAHITSGVITNIVTAVQITPGYWADSPQFEELIKITSKNFRLREVSADMAYSSRKNLKVVSSLGAVPYIPFKKGSVKKSRGCMIWAKMKGYFDEHHEEFMQHYHKRSNAETVFSMIKRKFGTHLYSKSEIGQINELLCRILSHNICVLIQEFFESDTKLDYNYCAKLPVYWWS